MIVLKYFNLKMMKKTFLTVLFVFLCVFSAGAQDFIVEFTEENYKETRASFSYTPLIYHSIQVDSAAGPKVIILEGKDAHYRNWLRHYIADNRRFILKVDPSRTDQFISAKVFITDVTTLHPIVDDKWNAEDNVVRKETKALSEDNFFLIVDKDETRVNLLRLVSQKMGYKVISRKTSDAALKLLKLQPEKFRMILVYPDIDGMTPDQLVNTMVSLKHTIPIVVETGYRNSERKKNLGARFAHMRSVYIKSVILDDFQTTIKELVRDNA